MRMIFSLVRGEMVPRFTNLVLGSVIELEPCHIPVFSAILLQSEEGECRSMRLRRATSRMAMSPIQALAMS